MKFKLPLSAPNATSLPSVNSKLRFLHAAIKRDNGIPEQTRQKCKTFWVSMPSDRSLGHRRSGIAANIPSSSSRSTGSKHPSQSLEYGRNRQFIWRTSSVGGERRKHGLHILLHERWSADGQIYLQGREAGERGEEERKDGVAPCKRQRFQPRAPFRISKE